MTKPTTIVDDLPPLAARLAMGIRFIAAGGGKLSFLLYQFSDLVQEGAKMGLSPSAVRFGTPIVSIAEIVAGVALIVGLRVRLAASVLLALLAMYTSLELIAIGGMLRRDAAFDLAVYVILLFWLVVGGGGRLSLDSKLR